MASISKSACGMRRKIEALLLPAEVEIVLQFDGYAAAHPELVAVVMQTAASDWAASRLAVAIERVAAGAAERCGHCACTRGDASMMPALKIERCEQFYTDTDVRSAQTYSYGALPVISPRPKSAQDPSRCYRLVSV